ncbi:Rrf2 family transcriptional regulator [Geomicrobium sp. JSM 1781026]|uniref:Rrf2 family transcriptional regulator n=1 Tax=Geomicrobium sp. JSM 1781026 TaxID=3344580 RepID=UPI0035BEDC1B
MKLSKATNYALHTMLHLAVGDDSGHTSVAKLAGHQNVSTTYLSKILTKLVKARMIVSVPGANGGYKLKAGWEKISILEMIRAVEGLPAIFDYCETHNPNCVIQRSIEAAEEKFFAQLDETRLEDLVSQVR